MEQFDEVLGGLVLVSGAVLVVYFIARYNYLIKKMLAEKGLFQPNSPARINKIDVAYVTVGVGVGLLISSGFSLLNLSEDTMDLLAWGIILICGAIGLIMASKQKK